MKKKTIELKVNNWAKLTLSQQKKAVEWLKQLADTLLKWKKMVSDDFTGQYP